MVAGFTSDFRFVNDSLLARLSGTKLSFFGLTFGVPLLLAAGLALLLFLALYLLIERTEFGLALGLAGRDAARLVGIRPQRMFAVAWGLRAALVAIAGAILVNFFAVYPQVERRSSTVLAYAIVALGGVRQRPRHPVRRAARRRDRRRDRRLPAAGLQGRLRVRLVSLDRTLPAQGLFERF